MIGPSTISHVLQMGKCDICHPQTSQWT